MKYSKEFIKYPKISSPLTEENLSLLWVKCFPALGIVRAASLRAVLERSGKMEPRKSAEP